MQTRAGIYSKDRSGHLSRYHGASLSPPKRTLISSLPSAVHQGRLGLVSR